MNSIVDTSLKWLENSCIIFEVLRIEVYKIGMASVGEFVCLFVQDALWGIKKVLL